MPSVTRFLLDARHSGYFFAVAVLLIYGLAPLAIDTFVQQDQYMFRLGFMSCAAAAAVVAGFNTSLFDGLIGRHRFRIPVNENAFHIIIWTSFVAFSVVAFSTADYIPIVSALAGGFSPEELDIQRGAFLKTRQGWEAGLGYVSAVYVGVLLPLSLARLFVARKSVAGFTGLAIFVTYALSYLQKALIAQPVIPLLYLSGRRVIWNYVGFAALIVGTLAIFYGNTLLARGVQSETTIREVLDGRKAKHPRDLTAEAESGTLFPPDFFSADFQPVSTKEYMVWRIGAVPIFTAADAVEVLQTKFDGKQLYGATSSLIAAIFGMQRVNYDAEVYSIQWGRTEVGRANSVYLTDGYVNFGWGGVFVFSFLVGLAFRVFARSPDEAVRSMWPLFAFNIIQASLIGTLLSAGFALLFFIALFVKLTSSTEKSACNSAHGTLL